MATQKHINRRSFLKLSLLSGAVALTGCYPVFIERNIVTINFYTINLLDLPPSFNGFTITHLTDLHFGPLVSESFIRNIIARANRLNSDIIACTGDYVHTGNTTEEIDTIWPLLSQLKAKYGVYSVLGNHDHLADTERSQYWLEKTGQGLRHDHVVIHRGHESITIGGAGDLYEDELKIDETFSGSPKDCCRILLAHNPDSIDTSFDTPISLMLSGHTHGGQVRIPFLGPPVLPVENKRYTSGLISTQKCPIFISRGLGWSLYPVRFNCYPEIAVIKLICGTTSIS